MQELFSQYNEKPHLKLARQLITGTRNVVYVLSNGADEFDQAVNSQTGVRLRRNPIVFFLCFPIHLRLFWRIARL